MGIIKIAIVCVLLVGAFIAGVYVGTVTLPKLEVKAEQVGERVGLAGFAVQTPEENKSRMYSWTTALCSTDGKCIDVHVACNGTAILNVTPISALVMHGEAWEDPRGNETSSLCPR